MDCKKGWLIFLFCCTSVIAFPQRSKVDSLLRVLSVAQSDTDKVKIYGSLATACYAIKPDSFFIFCHKGLDLARQIDWKQQVAKLDAKLGDMLTDTGNYALALKYEEEGLAINKAIGSTTETINNYCDIGRTYDFKSDFVKSSEYFFKAMSMAEQINDHEKMALIGTNLTACFCNQQDYKKAEKYGLVTLREGQLCGVQVHIYKACLLLGFIRTNLGDTAAATDYFEKAIAVCRKNGLTLNEAEAVTNLARIQKDAGKTLALLLQARSIYDRLSPGSFDSMDNWLSLGETYISLYKSATQKRKRDEYLDKAGTCLEQFMKKCKASNNINSYSDGAKLMATVAAYKGDYRKAYEYNNIFYTINDSIFSQANKNKIAGIESQRAIDLKNKEIENKQLQIGNQQKKMWLLISFVIFLTAVGVLLYRQSLVRKKNNTVLLQLNSELDEANKIKAKFFGILSHDLRSPVASLINFLQLQKRKPGQMSEAQVAEHENKIAASAKSLLETMETMLLWSKGQMEYFKPEKSMVPVNDLFAYLGHFFVNTENIAFEFLNNDNLSVFTDEQYLKTIMHNLTANAINALRQVSGGRIAWKAWKDKDKIFLSITDNGAGVGNEQLKALYDETAGSGARQGLGLHIIRDLARAVGCTVSLQYGNATGTEFILSF